MANIIKVTTTALIFGLMTKHRVILLTRETGTDFIMAVQKI